MRKRKKRVISASGFMMIGVFFFAADPQLASAQNDGFKLYQLNVFCENTSLVTRIFTAEATEGGTAGRPLMGTKVFCAGTKCAGGPVTLTAALAGLSANVSAALQKQVDDYQQNLAPGDDWFRTCLGDGKKPPEKRCEQSTPWLYQHWDDRATECKDRQPWNIEFDSKGFAFLTMCGSSVFVHNLKYRD
jgi:hypothetical protein